jgi:hypothetical protein
MTMDIQRYFHSDNSRMANPLFMIFLAPSNYLFNLIVTHGQHPLSPAVCEGPPFPTYLARPQKESLALRYVEAEMVPAENPASLRRGETGTFSLKSNPSS